MSTIRAATHTFNASENTKISIAGSNDLDLVLTANNKEGIRVDSNGRVGVGNSAPSAKLHVYDTVVNGSIVRSELGGGADGVYFDLKGGTSYRALQAANTTGTVEWVVGNYGTNDMKSLSFYTGTGGPAGGPAERMRIDSRGNVGIGITTPTSNLHVVGSANITGNLIVNGNTLFVDAIGNEVGIGISEPTSNLHVIGTANITSTIRDGKGDVRDIPINSQAAAYALVVADAGKFVSTSAGGIFVPNSAGVGTTTNFTAGQAVTIFNNSAGNQTITQNTSVTMYLAGTATTGNRTLAQRGVATVLCVAANTFVISGAGLT